MYPEVLLGQRHVFFIFASTSTPTTTAWPMQEDRKGGTANRAWSVWQAGSQEGSVTKACLPPAAIRAQPQGQESQPTASPRRTRREHHTKSQ